MKMKVVSIVFMGIAILSSAAWAGEHGNGSLLGGKAVLEFNPEEGFKMSERGLTAIGAKFAKLEGRAPWHIPAEALVRIKHATGVYRRYDGWISFVIVNVMSKGPKGLLVSSDDLQPDDEIATQGVPYLRMTEADLNSDTVDNCSH